MNNFNLTWKQTDTQYVISKGLYVNKFKVGNVHYDSCKSKNDNNKYAACCFLFGLKSNQGHFETEQEAMNKVELELILVYGSY